MEVAIVEPERVFGRVSIRFPAANYFIASSRLRPGMDGGYTVATLRRALQFAEHAGVTPVLLTFDFWPDYESVVQEFAQIGLMAADSVLRNLLQDARSTPEFLRAAATGAPPEDTVPDGITTKTDLDSAGRPWRTIVFAGSGATLYTDFLDFDGHPILRIPYLTGRADWHQAPIVITVFAADGAPVGSLAGFGELYRSWLEHVFDSCSLDSYSLDTSSVDASSLDTDQAGRTNVVVCESRQVGELLVDSRRSDLRLVHTVHSAHTAAPYEWDSPLDGLWASWFEVIDRFDAVIWLTEKQRRAVVRRFGEHDTFWVVPHAVDALPTLSPPEERDPNLAVIIGRLARLKRLDHALLAFRTVADGNPLARLVIYGDGPDEERLRGITREYRLQDVVEFRGHHPDAAEVTTRAAALVFTSSYEGQGLVVLEALARGCPVVSYDLNYGPSEMVTDGETGILVPNGDVDALAAALSSVLGHPERVAALSEAAHASAVQRSPERSMARMAELFETVLARPRRSR